MFLHACRRGKSDADNLKIDLYSSIKDFSKHSWQKAAEKGSFFLQYSYLQSLERTSPSNIDYYYAIVSLKDSPLAIACFQLIDIEEESIATFIHSFESKKKRSRMSANSNTIRFRLLVCGNIFISGEHGFYYLPDLKKQDAVDVLNKIINKIIKSEKKIRPISFILIKDFYEPLMSAGNLKKYKHASFQVEPNMVFKINETWKSFDDYLNALSSKYRIRAKKIIGKKENIIPVDFGPMEISDNDTRLKELYNEVHLRAKFKPSVLGMDYFVQMKTLYKDNFKFIAYYLEDTIVAFRSEFIMNDYRIEAHFIGLDYSLNNKYDLYQNILYDYVRDGIERGSQTIYFGRTALEMKSNIGARPYELACYIKHINPLFNFFTKQFIKYLQPAEWVMRDPFKKSLSMMHSEALDKVV